VRPPYPNSARVSTVAPGLARVILLGEMFGSQRGMGYILMIAMGTHDMQSIMSVTLILVLFAIAVSVVLMRIDRRLHRFS
jgi:NitT/TauT family transport system permease protein